MKNKNIIILAIETSCDDTCVALIKGGEKKKLKIKVLSNLISSQVKIHQKYGGVYPFLAKREHQKNLPLLFEKAKKEAESASRRSKIDLIAVTVGPGLEPCLWVGVNFAKGLAKKLKLPIIPINHIESHIFASLLMPTGSNSKFDCCFKPGFKHLNNMFPIVCLVVSGGHTQLILMREFGKYKILGETRDDAAGECFDKIARMLGLGYPGGPAIEIEASKKVKGLKFKVTLPRPMIHQKNYDFSFSGLKTAALYNYKKQKPNVKKSIDYIRAMSAETQQAIIDVLIYKTIKAAKDHKVKTIILGGGVAANDELRKQFKYKLKTLNHKVKFLVPSKIFCTDNALMVAITAYYHWVLGIKKDWKKITVNANLRIENEI